ncbi:hypothetical protein [Alicyclobacillus dauci]|uniref:Uncharacterized protein n=1 Tax=Alicyclobacillus dauci TaxID=1475485 RepID=A0ABY6Z2F6_9BACL|nr:hypothetical protein [Alicyclobacillus dauci]WAH36693.1 hypothetical protein NZD86_21370 [Alicyclobacillus dauci]
MKGVTVAAALISTLLGSFVTSFWLGPRVHADDVPFPGTWHQIRAVAIATGLHHVYLPQHLSEDDVLTIATSEQPGEVTLQYDEFLLRESKTPLPIDQHDIVSVRRVNVGSNQSTGKWYTFHGANGVGHALVTKQGDLWMELIPRAMDDSWNETAALHIIGSLMKLDFSA